MLFVGIVFILMWLFQVVFLEHFYEYIKIRDTEKVANNLIHAYHAGSFRQTALNIGLSNDLCIELMDKNGLYRRMVELQRQSSAWQLNQTI